MTQDALSSDAASPLACLLNGPMRPGIVSWIGLRPDRRQPVVVVGHADMDPVSGLIGDHYQSQTTRARQVTLIQAESLTAIAAYLGLPNVQPEQLRRNIVVAGINLHALKNRRFELGSAILEATGDCHPCSRMEEILGAGGYNAMRGHGGITARIVMAGQVHVGDLLTRVDQVA